MDDGERRDRLTLLLALEIRRVVRDLAARHELLVGLWSKTRQREPFERTLFIRWPTVGMPDLLVLEAEAIEGIEAFYRAVEDLRLYVATTEDMPATLSDVLGLRRQRLRTLANAALEALGHEPLPPPPAPTSSPPDDGGSPPRPAAEAALAAPRPPTEDDDEGGAGSVPAVAEAPVPKRRAKTSS